MSPEFPGIGFIGKTGSVLSILERSYATPNNKSSYKSEIIGDLHGNLMIPHLCLWYGFRLADALNQQNLQGKTIPSSSLHRAYLMADWKSAKVDDEISIMKQWLQCAG